MKTALFIVTKLFNIVCSYNSTHIYLAACLQKVTENIIHILVEFIINSDTSISNNSNNGKYQNQTHPMTDPPKTFLHLPREIRDTIYELYLVAGNIGIVVWNGKPCYHDGFFCKQHGDRQGWLKGVVAHFISNTDLTQSFAWNTFQCNKTISQEASAIFYSKNTFIFPRQNTWDTIAYWLKMIGAANRGYLTKIRILVHPPPQIGGFESHLRGSRSLFSMNSYSEHTIDPTNKYAVEVPNPAIEKLFELLGEETVAQKSKVAIEMELDPGLLPFRNGLLHTYFSMHVPNFIEKSRARYSNEMREISVLWGGIVYKQIFLALPKSRFTDLGWEVAGTLEFGIKKLDGSASEYIQFTLRQTGLVEL